MVYFCIETLVYFWDEINKKHNPTDEDVVGVLTAIVRLLCCDDNVTVQECYFFKMPKKLLKGWLSIVNIDIIFIDEMSERGDKLLG